MNDCITTTKQSTTKQCAYFLGYTVRELKSFLVEDNNLDLFAIVNTITADDLALAAMALN